MNITRIDLKGDTGKFPTLARKQASDHLHIQVLSPQGTRDESVPLVDATALREAARRIQHELDGFPGTQGDTFPYANAVQLLADQ